MEVNKHELNLLRHRFVEDTAAPIQVLQDPYFSQRLAIFDKDFNTLKDYKEYVSMVEKEFGGNVTVFLEQYKALRDRIITYVSNTDAFKSFCEDDKITKLDNKELAELIQEVRKETKNVIRDKSQPTKQKQIYKKKFKYE